MKFLWATSKRRTARNAAIGISTRRMKIKGIVMTDSEKLKIALEALDFYSAPARYMAKSKKQKARILQDKGAIARRTVQMLSESEGQG